MKLLFWSGRAFDGPGLVPEGTCQAAHKHYETASAIEATHLARWLRKAKKLQWNYENIVRRRGKLERIGDR